MSYFILYLIFINIIISQIKSENYITGTHIEELNTKSSRKCVVYFPASVLLVSNFAL